MILKMQYFARCDLQMQFKPSDLEDEVFRGLPSDLEDEVFRGLGV